MTRPAFYQGIIAISPSMQWDDQYTVGAFEEWISEKPEVSGALFLHAALGGMAPAALVATSETSFELRSRGLVLRFTPDQETAVERLSLQRGERTVPFTRVVDGERWPAAVRRPRSCSAYAREVR